MDSRHVLILAFYSNRLHFINLLWHCAYQCANMWQKNRVVYTEALLLTDKLELMHATWLLDAKYIHN